MSIDELELEADLLLCDLDDIDYYIYDTEWYYDRAAELLAEINNV